MARIKKDEYGNIIYKQVNGYEYWIGYDSDNNVIHYRDSDGDENWYTYDSNGSQIRHLTNPNITHQESLWDE